MADIFLSYKKEDRPLAQRLVDALRREGKSIWWDEALAPTEAWDAMIEKEIAASRAVIVLWSPRSVQSDWVRSEAHYAQDHRKLVPVMIERCSIPLAFMLRQAVDLSDGRLDRTNPNFEKLLAWIDALQTGADAPAGEATAADVAGAAVPVKTVTGERWLGPGKSSRLALLGLLAVLAIGAALFFARGALFGNAAKTDVYVDPFTVVAGAGLPAGLANSVNAEIGAQLNAASLITPLDGDGRPKPNAYRMSGTIQQDGDKIVAFAKIFAPGAAAPVLSPRIEVPSQLRPSAAKSLAQNAAGILRCVATASNSSGASITILPEAAIRPWAQFCQMTFIGEYDPTTAEGYLKQVVKADPNFANGWANLAENRLPLIFAPGGDRNAQLTEYRQEVERALNLDKDNQKALALKALDALGFTGQGSDPSRVAPLRNFAEFDRLIKLANDVRSSDCGCEAIIATQTLFALGRPSAALPYASKVVANDPSDLRSIGLRALILDALGRGEEADRSLVHTAADWPGSPTPHNFGLALAIGRRDWEKADTELQKISSFPMKDDVVTVIEAAKTGNKAAVDAAMVPFLASLAGGSNSTNLLSVTLAAATGHNAEAMAGIRRAVQKGDIDTFSAMWVKGLEGVRALPDFALLVRQLQLPSYWHLAGHRPDSCTAEAGAAYCRL